MRKGFKDIQSDKVGTSDIVDIELRHLPNEDLNHNEMMMSKFINSNRCPSEDKSVLKQPQTQVSKRTPR